MSLHTLLANPILKRELELRASRDEGYRLFNYAGPGLFLLLLQLPVIYGLLGSSLGWGTSAAWTAPLFLVTFWLLVVYFSHAAARFCAGAFAVERERGTMDALRLIPWPSRRLISGKLVAAILPLLVEACAAGIFLTVYALYGAVPMVTVLAATVVNVVSIGFFGMWGMFWSLYSHDVLSALSRSFCTVLAFNVLPLLTGLFFFMVRGGAHYTPGSGEPGSPLFYLISPLSFGMSLVHPNDVSMAAFQHDISIVALQACAFGVTAILLYRASLRRLAGR